MSSLFIQVRNAKMRVLPNASTIVFSHKIIVYKTNLVLNESCANFNSIRKLDESYLSKNKLIRKMNFQNPNDGAPFYNLSVASLLRINKITQKDNLKGFCKNRLYYIAEQIRCEPSTLSVLIVKRMFIYQLSFDWLEKSLKVLLGKRNGCIR